VVATRRGCESPAGARAHASSPAAQFARAKSAGVFLVHGAHAIAETTAAARSTGLHGDGTATTGDSRTRPAPAVRTTAPQHSRWRAPQRSRWRAPRLPRRRQPHPARERSSRTRCCRVRQRAQREDRRRACSALGRAGTRTSSGRSGAAPARGPRRARRSRRWWRRRSFRASAARPGCAYSPSEGSPVPSVGSGCASRPQAADDQAGVAAVADCPAAAPGASGGASAG
jgi:hypothetical protein